MSRWQWEDLDESPRIDVMLAQIHDLVAASERVTGRKLDLDRLREIVDRVNQQEAYFDEVRTIIATAEKLPARLGEVMSQTMGIQWHRGTEWALEQARAFRDEIKHRADNEMWVCPNEQYRLMYVGQGLWQNLDFFTQFEERYGAVFVRSNYLSIACDGLHALRHPRSPARNLASRYVTMSEQMHMPRHRRRPGRSTSATRHRVDGGLSIEGWWGGRMVNRQLEEAGCPILDFPVDPVDGRNTWDDAKMKALVSANSSRPGSSCPQGKAPPLAGRDLMRHLHQPSPRPRCWRSSAVGAHAQISPARGRRSPAARGLPRSRRPAGRDLQPRHPPHEPQLAHPSHGPVAVRRPHGCGQGDPDLRPGQPRHIPRSA